MEMCHVAFYNQLPECMPLEARARVRISEQAIGGLVATLSTWLLDGHKRDVREEYDFIYFPKSPWQFIKQSYAPKWFTDRWPVLTVEKRIKIAVHHHFVCPHIAVEDKGSHVAWMGRQSGQIK